MMPIGMMKYARVCRWLGAGVEWRQLMHSGNEGGFVERRWVCFVLGLVIAALLAPGQFAAPSPDDEKTVTLAVSGMT